MTLSGEEVLGLVRQLPDEVDIKELIYRLYLLEKLAAAEADITARGTLPGGSVGAYSPMAIVTWARCALNDLHAIQNFIPRRW